MRQDHDNAPPYPALRPALKHPAHSKRALDTTVIGIPIGMARDSRKES